MVLLFWKPGNQTSFVSCVNLMKVTVSLLLHTDEDVHNYNDGYSACVYFEKRS